MLIQFAVANYRSIKDEATLSLVAGLGREHRERNVRVPVLQATVRATPLLRSAAIYGANAAGKTNLIQALGAMRETVVNSSRTDRKLPVTPFLLNAEHDGQPTQFEVACIVAGVRYQYGFSATEDVVVDEWLYAWPRGRPQLWFTRQSANAGEPAFEFGGKLQGDREVWRRATRDNTLFLSAAGLLNSPQLRPLYNWFKTHVHVAGIGGWNRSYSEQCVQGERKAEVVRFLQAADLAVSDLRVVERDGRVQSVHIVRRGPGGQPVELDMDDESDGTKKMFALAGPWIEVLEKGHVAVIDELHDHLHPMLVRYLVERFHDSELDSDAQLVFATHDTSILSQDVFRRDQIWFCERNDRHETALVPLSDFSPRKGLENLERSYLAGRYGAVPYLRSA